MRSTLDADPKPPPTSLARRWLARYLVLASLQSAPIRLVIPIAVRTSALRRLASASDVRVMAKPVAVRVGSRVIVSVSIVMMPRMMAPISAASPI